MNAAEELVAIWLLDSDVATSVAAFPWVADEIDEEEIELLRGLRNISTVNLDLGRQLLGYPWLADGISSHEANAVAAWGGIVSNDLDVGRALAGLPWLADGLTSHEPDVLDALNAISSNSPEAAKAMTGLPWFADGVANEEWTLLFGLKSVASNDALLARTLTALPWLADKPTSNERRALDRIRQLASTDVQLARALVELPWFVDGIADEEREILGDLNYLATTYPHVTRRLTSLAWMSDAATEIEQGVIRDISYISGEERRESMRQRLEWMLERLADNPTAEEFVLIAVLGGLWSASDSTQVWGDRLRQSPYIQSATVELPLAGEVNLWVLQDVPFPNGENLLGLLEDVAWASEEFMRMPFPIDDIILVVRTRAEYAGGRGGHHGEFMVLHRLGDSFLRRETVYHEVGHYYFSGTPLWLSEGGAELIEFYTSDRVGLKSLEAQKPITRELVDNCFNQGMRNIQELNEAQESAPLLDCNYWMGAYFLLNLLETLGEEAMSSALRELSLLMKPDTRSSPKRRRTGRS